MSIPPSNPVWDAMTNPARHDLSRPPRDVLIAYHNMTDAMSTREHVKWLEKKIKDLEDEVVFHKQMSDTFRDAIIDMLQEDQEI